LETRQSQARSERQFIEVRLQDVSKELKAAEDRVQEFLQSNRSIEDSPRLVFERERLERELTMRQQVYASLVQSFEQARIDEVRDSPVVTVIDPPSLPIDPDSRRLLQTGSLTLLISLLVAVLLAVALDQASDSRSRAPDQL